MRSEYIPLSGRNPHSCGGFVRTKYENLTLQVNVQEFDSLEATFCLQAERGLDMLGVGQERVVRFRVGISVPNLRL